MRPKNLLIAISIAIVPLILGHMLILQRVTNGPSRYLTIRGDTTAYVRMSNGDFVSVSAPYKYRVLVPWLTSVLPFSPVESMRVISYTSLCIFYVFTLLGSLQIGIRMNAAIYGLFLTFTSSLHLYNYHNPFLIDSFHQMVIAIMIFAFLNDYFVLFGIMSLLGVLAKETVIIIVPCWLVWRKAQAIILVLSAIAILISLRYLIPDSNNPIQQGLLALVNVAKMDNIGLFLKDIVLSWKAMWLFGIIGMLLLPDEKFFRLASVFCLLFIGALLSSFLATDTDRMFSTLSPLMAIFCGQIYESLNKKRRGHIIGILILALAIVQLLTSVPNRIFGENSGVFDSSSVISKVDLSIGVVFCVFTTVALGQELHNSLISKLAYLLHLFCSPHKSKSESR